MTIIKSKKKILRRLGVNIWETKNFTPIKKYSHKSYYGECLFNKQLLKFHYGNLNLKYLKKTFQKAKKIHGRIDENVTALLESRLDSIVYKAGWGKSIFHAKQLVSHKHIALNGKKVSIPSIRMKVGDKLEIITMSAINKEIKKHTIPSFITVEGTILTLIKLPTIKEANFKAPIDFAKVESFLKK